MDDRLAYALHALLNDHYDIGRILRFRQIRRGTQAECYELLTAEQHEYALFLYPPEFSRQALCDAGPVLDRLAAAGFPVSRPVPGRDSCSGTGTLPIPWAIEGPQGSHFFLATLAPGQAVPAADWSNHDLSNLGLRLGWLHRTMRDAFAAKATQAMDSPVANSAVINKDSPAQRLVKALESSAPRGRKIRQVLSSEAIDRLLSEVEKLAPVCTGYVHGGISPDGVLLDGDRHISSVVDWGLFSTGLPAQDVIDVFVHWCVQKEGEVRADAAQSLLQAYLSLEKLRGDQWHPAAVAWCAHRLGAALMGRSHLPRGFASILENPHSLSATLTICQSKL